MVQSCIFKNAAFIFLTAMLHCSPILFYLLVLRRSNLPILPQSFTVSGDTSSSLTPQIYEMHHFPEDLGYTVLVSWDSGRAIDVTSARKRSRKRGIILKDSKRNKGFSMWLSIEGKGWGFQMKRMDGGGWSSSLKGLRAWCQGLTGRHICSLSCHGGQKVCQDVLGAVDG